MSKPPVTALEIPPEWPVAVADALNNCKGVSVRPGPDNSIEAWSALRNRWMKLQLPGGGVAFATEADRDLVLGAILGLNVLPMPAAPTA